MEVYELDLGEATVLALAKQENIRIILTDDLEAREVALSLGFIPHGSLGIVLRALRIKRIDKKKAKEIVESLEKNSSLFLSKDLVLYIHKEIDAYKKN